MNLTPEGQKTLMEVFWWLCIALFVAICCVIFGGCSGDYQAAMVPLDSPPAIELLGNPEELPLAPQPMWKKVLYFGTVGH